MKELIDAITVILEDNVYKLTKQYLAGGRASAKIFTACQSRHGGDRSTI